MMMNDYAVGMQANATFSYQIHHHWSLFRRTRGHKSYFYFMPKTPFLGLEILLHGLFWVLTAWLILSSFSIESIEYTVENGVEHVQVIRNPAVVHQLMATLVLSICLFYSNAYSLLRNYQSEKITTMVILSVLLFLSALLLQSIFVRMSPVLKGPGLQAKMQWAIMGFYFFVSTGYALGRITWKSTIRHKSILLEKKQMELNALRHQLQPHFLFNALNNLLALVDQKQNPKLADAIDQLSLLLRHVVDTRAPIAVSKEIEFVRNYIQVQQLRYAEQEVTVQLEVLGTFDQQPVEPGIFIPFVENAFKHGTEPEAFSRISMQFDLRNRDKILFRISNPIRQAVNTGGTGLKAVIRRLELLYPGSHTLSIDGSSEYLVTLTLSTHEGDHRR